MNACRQLSFLQHIPFRVVRRPRTASIISNPVTPLTNYKQFKIDRSTIYTKTLPSATATGEPSPQKTSQPSSPKQIARGNKLVIVGLGNPGSRYVNTRHNVGFSFLDSFSKRNNGTPFRADKRSQSDISTLSLSGCQITLVKPRTFMNDSGRAVRSVLKYFNIPLSGLIVVVDDISLDVGRIRLRAQGSAGGHNGLKSIQNCMGSQQYARLKIGVGTPGNGAEGWKDHVLGKFSKNEMKLLEEVEWDVMEVLEYWVEQEDIRKVISKVGELGNTKAKR